MIENIPTILIETGKFCTWRKEDRDGKVTKVPHNPRTGRMAQSNNPATFAPFAVAVEAFERNNGYYDGIGVMITDNLAAIDMDDCVVDGILTSEAVDIISTMESYTEYSPSGTGVRILFLASGFTYDKGAYYINNQKIGLEIYVAGVTQKYVTVTGNALYPGYDLEERGERLQIILDKYMSRDKPTLMICPRPPEPLDISYADLLEKAIKAGNGALFCALYTGDTSGYESHSEADLALCSLLAFWTGCDSLRMDKLFRESGLMRNKWDEGRNGTTYGHITIQKAINDCSRQYNPQTHFKEQAAKVSTGSGKDKPALAELHPEKNERYGWNDIGNGYLFADWYKDNARYCPDRKKWFIYNGAYWQPDSENLKVMELCKELADGLMNFSLTLKDERMRQAYIDFVKHWQKRSYRETVLKDAAGVYPIQISCFDADPYLFNCLNGTLNLRTREFRPHSAEDILSKISGVKYDQLARCERWKRFINEVMENDTEKALFLQKALGLALTGDTSYECFFLLYGPKTRNGKGTTTETFMELVGDYGKTAKPDTIAQKQTANGSGPSEDIARLAGARFVNIAEPDKRLVLSPALVKTLTGNDTITARYLNENSFEYRPQCKLFINTNHLPDVPDGTIFSSGRVKVITFGRHFSENEQDHGLKAELARPDNLSGILNWCLDGLWMLQETGLVPPPAVIAATNQYRQDSDKFSRFIADELEEGREYEEQNSAVFARFQSWCGLNGFRECSIKTFNAEMQNYFTLERKRPTSGGEKTTMITGYRLRPVKHADILNIS